jgi:divalent metal cation (Fe/Co/Zn/Cd) transporter
VSQLRTYPLAFALLALTLFYNVVEGVIAIASGLRAGSLVLLSFGADSYLEVLAAAAVMWRLSYRDEEAGERAEGKALRFIGITFLALAAAVVFQAVYAFAAREGASESRIGIALLTASFAIMPVLALAKLRTAAKSNLPALAAEAKETVACSYLSLTALAGLLATAMFGAWWIDALAALLMVPWLVREGLEGIRGEACFDGAKTCWCRECWFGLRGCTDIA